MALLIDFYCAQGGLFMARVILTIQYSDNIPTLQTRTLQTRTPTNDVSPIRSSQLSVLVS